jgi:hypothetical protein
MTANCKETIHFSVRVLSDNGRDKQGQFLRDYTLNSNGPYSWGSPQYPHIPEDVSNKLEFDILEEWLREEKEFYGGEAGTRLMSAFPVMQKVL